MTFLTHRPTYCYTAFLLAVGLCTGNTHAAWQTPLSEQDKAQLGVRAVSQYQTGSRTSTNSKNNLKLDVEVLMVELQEKKSRKQHEPRLAEVFVFDYSTNRASVQLINADTHKLVSTRSIDNIHLPLNLRERELTTLILLKDSNLLNELQNEYVEQFGLQLATLEQLDMKVSIWEPGVNDTNANNCRQTRCALVSVFTHEHYNFSVEPVVELQNSIVHLDLIQ